MKKILALAMLFACAEAAYSLAGMQVFYGYRTQKEGKVARNAQTVTLAGHLSPLPLIPVGLGVTYAPWISYQTTDLEESATGMEIGVELLGWLPMVPFVTPYAKVNYTVWGKQKLTYKEGDDETKNKENKLSGMSGAVGVSYDVVPLVSVMAEAGYAQRKIADDNYSHATLSIGVEVGI